MKLTYSSRLPSLTLSYVIYSARSIKQPRSARSSTNLTRSLRSLVRLGQIGGKGTPRRKVVKKSQAASQGDDRKLQAALKKLNVTAVAGVEEVNMFKDDGNVLHFASPRGGSFFFCLPFLLCCVLLSLGLDGAWSGLG
jgi:hypothetical protein